MNDTHYHTFSTDNVSITNNTNSTTPVPVSAETNTASVATTSVTANSPTVSTLANATKRNPHLEFTVGNTTVDLNLTTYGAFGCRKGEDALFRATELFNGLDDEALRKGLHLPPKTFTKSQAALEVMGCICTYEGHTYRIPAAPNFNPDAVKPFTLPKGAVLSPWDPNSLVPVKIPFMEMSSGQINSTMGYLWGYLNTVKCCKVQLLKRLLHYSKSTPRLLKILESWGLVLLRDDLVYLIPRDPNFSPEKEFRRQALHYDLQYAAGFISMPFVAADSSAYYQELQEAEEAKKAARRAARQAKPVATADAEAANEAQAAKAAEAVNTAEENKAAAEQSKATTTEAPAEATSDDIPCIFTQEQLAHNIPALQQLLPPKFAEVLPPLVTSDLCATAVCDVRNSDLDLPQPYSFTRLTPLQRVWATTSGLSPASILPIIAYHAQFKSQYVQHALHCGIPQEDAVNLVCAHIKSNILKEIALKPYGKEVLRQLLSTSKSKQQLSSACAWELWLPRFGESNSK